jgi:homoserine kinase
MIRAPERGLDARATFKKVFAPATVANVAVGFDILGFPVDVAGDEVTVWRTDEPTVSIEGLVGTTRELPLNPAENTASVGLLQMIRDLRLDHGFKVSVNKGIPVGSGMGGSAASAVGAIVAANALLDRPLPKETLLRYAVLGEFVASGTAHSDNASPCLYGGLTLTRSVSPIDVVRIPVPEGLLCVLVRPHLEVETREARKILKSEVPLKDHVRQSSNLAGFLAGCFKGDFGLIRRSLSDVLIEPQRASLIHGFAEAKKAALEAGALGCSISGSGPATFALADSQAAAAAVRDAMVAAYGHAGVITDAWISPISAEGARLV